MSSSPPVKKPCTSNDSEEDPEIEYCPVSPVPPARIINCDVPLIPNYCASALIQNFSTVFGQRYCDPGNPVPPFFIGSLQKAISEAFDKPDFYDRCPLALYINHDGATSHGYFATKILCFDSILFMLKNMFILWPWDVTETENQVKLMTWLAECDLYDVLSDVTLHLKKLLVDRNKEAFPLLLLVTKGQEGFQLRDSISAESSDPTSVIEMLKRVWNIFEKEKSVEIRNAEMIADSQGRST